MTTDLYYDVAIIGGGPAGMSAAMWCADLALGCVLIEARSELGGQLLNVYNRIENYPGVSAENGRAMRGYMLRSLEGRRFDTLIGSSVTDADLEKKALTLESGETVRSNSIIIATGVRRRKLGVPGEDKFAGRGILGSGAKDSKAAIGKNVIVVGGGDAAIENALILSEHAEKVTVVHRRDVFKARSEFLNSARSKPNIEFLSNKIVKNFEGDDRLAAVNIHDANSNRVEKLETDLALVRVGFEPNSELFLGQIESDENGYLLVDRDCKTSKDLVYAIGDVRRPLSQTVSGAVGDGATATFAAVLVMPKNL